MKKKGFIPTVTTVCDISRFCDNAKYMEEKDRSAVKLQISSFSLFLAKLRAETQLYLFKRKLKVSVLS